MPDFRLVWHKDGLFELFLEEDDIRVVEPSDDPFAGSLDRFQRMSAKSVIEREYQSYWSSAYQVTIVFRKNLENNDDIVLHKHKVALYCRQNIVTSVMFEISGRGHHQAE